MPPALGSTHSHPRRDSGLVRLWEWARARRGTWTCTDAIEACDLSERRCRAMVAALHAAGLIDQTSPQVSSGYRAGWTPAEWRLNTAGREIKQAPIMVIDHVRGVITGMRAQTDRDRLA